MKKILFCLQIVLNVVVIFLIPIVPGTYMGGMMSDGNIYTKNVKFTIFEAFKVLNDRFSIIEVADSNYFCNRTYFSFYICILIIFNILIYFLLRKLNKNIKGKIV